MVDNAKLSKSGSLCSLGNNGKSNRSVATLTRIMNLRKTKMTELRNKENLLKALGIIRDESFPEEGTVICYQYLSS